MNAFTLGPLVLSGERFAIIAGVFVFMIGAGLLASRVSPRFNLWSTVLVFGGLAAARLGHVATHWEYLGPTRGERSRSGRAGSAGSGSRRS